jgi:hypothetical protein
MKLFLDDVRDPPNDDEDWIIARTASDFMFAARYADFISFDHDLGLDQPTGYELLNILEAMYRRGEIWTESLPTMVVHSANPVGAKNMRTVIDQIVKFKQSDTQP